MITPEEIEELDQFSQMIICGAIEVHKAIGPGLLESVYEKCLCRELDLMHLAYQRQVPLVLNYKGIQIGEAYRIDILVVKKIVLEIKAIEKIEPVHRAQLLSYLKLGQYPLGLIINFHVPKLVSGIVRMVN